MKCLKKESAALRLKTDSFVVGSDTHFPTDYNLLWDSARMCINIVGSFRCQDGERLLAGVNG
jgi:IS5 family transposase